MKLNAYSLWAESAWLVYWSSESGNTLETQVCTINGKSFYYKQIKKERERVLEICMKEAETTSTLERKKLEDSINTWMVEMEDKFQISIDKGLQK